MEEVLLIDDDVEFCSMLAQYLGKNGFRIRTAHRGDTGLLKAQQGHWAMILLDVMLPGKNGFEVVRLIRRQSSVKVLLLTARGAEMDRLAALECGADDYLPKPFDPKELLARMRVILRRKICLQNPLEGHLNSSFVLRALVLAIGVGSLVGTSGFIAQSQAQPNPVQTDHPGSPDISGTWVAKMSSPMGEMEIVYKLKVDNGKITGTQSLPFGDSPIVDGQVTGDSFHFTVELESFGDIQKKEVSGKIVGDTLVLTPAMPGPPPEGGPGGAAPGPPPGAPAGPPPGGAGEGPPVFRIGPVTAKRGVPTPSNRAPSVDYKKLPRIALPALHPVPTNGLAQTPPMGWNSWNKFQTHIDDATVRGIADAMVSSGMKDAGYQYVIIDDGWQGTRGADGSISPNSNFPDMKALAGYVHSKGLKIGIYSSPGPRTCGGFEGSYGHEEEDAKAFADWGMDYLKYDWCTASRIWKDSDMHAAYQVMGEALAKSGRPIVYALCQYGRAGVEHWGTQVGANLWRTTFDIRDHYDSMAKIGFAQSDLAAAASPGHWNDPDMLEVGNGGMSTDEYKTHFSLWAMIAAPLIAGNDIRNMNPEVSAILMNKEVIAVDQDSMGVGGKRVSTAGDIEIWKKPLASGDTAIAIFNHSNQEMRSVVSWDTLGIGKENNVRDLWTHADRGNSSDAFSEPVPAHGVIMLRLHPVK